MNKAEINAACWAALEAVARKECRRDALVAGAEYDVTLRVAGEVRTKPFACEATARVVVNHDGVRVVSQSPPIPHLVAILLGLLPRSQRENACCGNCRSDLPRPTSGCRTSMPRWPKPRKTC